MRESIVLWGGEERAGLWRHGATGNQGPRGLVPPRHTGILAHPDVFFELGSRTDSWEKIRMRFSRVWMKFCRGWIRFSRVWMRFSQSWMRFSRVVRASDSQCRSRNCTGFDPSILRHSGIWGAADETVLNTVHKKNQTNSLLKIRIRTSSPFKNMRIRPFRKCRIRIWPNWEKFQIRVWVRAWEYSRINKTKESYFFFFQFLINQKLHCR
jgi:hypothetical protein